MPKHFVVTPDMGGAREESHSQQPDLIYDLVLSDSERDVLYDLGPSRLDSLENGKSRVEETKLFRQYSATQRKDESKYRTNEKDIGKDQELDEEDEQDSDRRMDWTPGIWDMPSGTKLFACPYYKRYPQKYTVAHCSGLYRDCSGPGWKTIKDVKNHVLLRHPVPPSCVRCYKVFRDQQSLDRHVHQPEACDVKPAQTVEGVTRYHRERIKRELRHLDSDGARWVMMYNILFPDASVPDPYYDEHGPQYVLKRTSLDITELYSTLDILTMNFPNPNDWATYTEGVEDSSPGEHSIWKCISPSCQGEHVVFRSIGNLQRHIMDCHVNRKEAENALMGNSEFTAPGSTSLERERSVFPTPELINSGTTVSMSTISTAGDNVEDTQLEEYGQDPTMNLQLEHVHGKPWIWDLPSAAGNSQSPYFQVEHSEFLFLGLAIPSYEALEPSRESKQARNQRPEANGDENGCDISCFPVEFLRSNRTEVIGSLGARTAVLGSETASAPAKSNFELTLESCVTKDQNTGVRYDPEPDVNLESESFDCIFPDTTDSEATESLEYHLFYQSIEIIVWRAINELSITLGHQNRTYTTCNPTGERVPVSQNGNVNSSQTQSGRCTTGAKRCLSAGNDSPTDDGDLGGDKKKTPRMNEPDSKITKKPYLKCYFWANDPSSHCKSANQKFSTCPSGFPNFRQLSGHCVRHRLHLAAIHCPRCFQEFPTDEDMESHRDRQPIPCTMRLPVKYKGITPIQRREMKSRTRGMKPEGAKWRAHYKIIFPEVEDKDIPSAFVEPSMERKTDLDWIKAFAESYSNAEVPQRMQNLDFGGDGFRRGLFYSFLDELIADYTQKVYTEFQKRQSNPLQRPMLEAEGEHGQLTPPYDSHGLQTNASDPSNLQSNSLVSANLYQHHLELEPLSSTANWSKQQTELRNTAFWTEQNVNMGIVQRPSKRHLEGQCMQQLFNHNDLQENWEPQNDRGDSVQSRSPERLQSPRHIQVADGPTQPCSDPSGQRNVSDLRLDIEPEEGLELAQTSSGQSSWLPEDIETSFDFDVDQFISDALKKQPISDILELDSAWHKF